MTTINTMNPAADTSDVNGPSDKPAIGNTPGATMVARAAYEAANSWRDGHTGPMTEGANDALNKVHVSIGKAVTAIETAELNAHKALRETRWYPEGRVEVANTEIAKGNETAQTAIADARIALTIAEAHLTTEAMPKVAKGDELTARQDALLVLNGKGDMTVKVQALASRQDSIGGLVAGTDFLRLWGMSTGKNADMIEALVTSAREAAIDAAARNGGDPVRQTAALMVRQARGKLAAAIGGVESARQHLKPRL